MALIFKYYIFKYSIFKENILEALDNNLNFEAVNTIPIIDTVSYTGTQIYNIDEQIIKLKDTLDQSTDIKQHNDQTYNQLSGNLTTLQSDYTTLNKEFNQLLADKKNEIKLQSNSLSQGIVDQTNVKTQIQKQNDAEQKTVIISNNAKTYAQTAKDAVNNGIIAIQNGDIQAANTANNNAKNAYNAILNSKTDMDNNVTISAFSETGTKMQTQFNSYLNDAQKYAYNANIIPPIATAVNNIHNASSNSLISFSNLSSAGLSANNATTSRDAQRYVNIVETEYNNIGNHLQTVISNISVLNNITSDIKPTFSNSKNPTQIHIDMVDRYSKAGEIKTNAISAEKKTEAAEKAAAEKAAAEAKAAAEKAAAERAAAERAAAERAAAERAAVEKAAADARAAVEKAAIDPRTKLVAIGSPVNLDLYHSLCHDAGYNMYKSSGTGFVYNTTAYSVTQDGTPDGGPYNENIRGSITDGYRCNSYGNPWSVLARCPNGSELNNSHTNCIRRI